MPSFEEYAKKTSETAIYPTKVDVDFSLAYLGLKLCGECSELRTAVLASFSEADRVKECGDVCWYVAQIAISADLDLATKHFTVNRNLGGALDILASAPGQIAELIGKAYRDNDGRLSENAQATIESRLSWLLDAVAGVLQGTTSITFDQMLQTNLDKLAKRKAENKLHGSGDNR